MKSKTKSPSSKTVSESPIANSRRVALQAAFAAVAGGAVLDAKPRSEWTPKKAVVCLKPGESAEAGLLSSCIRSGHLIFTSGTGGWYPERRKEPGDATVQMRSALQTMKDHLELAGSSMNNVLKIHVALVDPENNWDLMNIAYKEFFPTDPPARCFIGSTGFRRKGVLLQVDCIAYVD